MTDLRAQFGQIDIYLFDQILRGRVSAGMRILDAGCGSGRNLVWFLREQFEVYGADSEMHAIFDLRRLAENLAPHIPADHFRVEHVEEMSFPDQSMDMVLSSAVLHFARSDDHFIAMLNGGWRKLKQGGLFFCRLASSIGIERQIIRIEGRRHLLPDGSERYLVDEAFLEKLSADLGGRFADPLKTTVVQNQRSMTTWVLRRVR